MSNAIGGYFELEFPSPGSFLYPSAYEFQSARAAFLALLREVKPSRVFIPNYICDSMIAPLKKAGVEFSFYSLDVNFNVVADFDLSEFDCLFYVNYFGVFGKNIDRLFEKYNSGQIILDHSQAFYATPRNCLATIYSPRKFFGVPDGGLLLTNVTISEPAESDKDSVVRAMPGLMRLAEAPEVGYAAYQKAESSLEQFEPLRISQLSRRILHSVNFEAARARRNENFNFLHQELGGLNQITIDVQNVDGPLCYPFFSGAVDLRAHLIGQKIFVATYWPEIVARVSNTSFESELVKYLLPLPCDQRYGLKEMRRIVEICLDFMKTR